jgi:hypothetical protein
MRWTRSFAPRQTQPWYHRLASMTSNQFPHRRIHSGMMYLENLSTSRRSTRHLPRISLRVRLRIPIQSLRLISHPHMGHAGSPQVSHVKARDTYGLVLRPNVCKEISGGYDVPPNVRVEMGRTHGNLGSSMGHFHLLDRDPSSFNAFP